jgi:hypothetical protein
MSLLCYVVMSTENYDSMMLYCYAGKTIQLHITTTNQRHNIITPQRHNT